MSAVGRRTFLRGALVAVGGAAGAAALAGCDTVTRSTDLRAINARVALPTYVRYQGPKPDRPSIGANVPDAFTRYPQTVRAITERPGDGSMLRGLVPTYSPIPPAKGRNGYWTELDRRLNLKTELTISPAADYANKFQTALAGDVLGDIWNIQNSPAYLAQILEAKAQDLTEYLSGDAIKRYPFLANIPTQSWQGCVFSGGIYAVPITRGIQSTLVVMSRADLFEQRGVPDAFGSVEELMRIAAEMTDEKQNRWAFANFPISTVSAMLGQPNMWEEKGGRLTQEIETEGHLDVLEIGRKMVADGVVHPEAVTAPNTKVWFNQGSAAMVEDSYSAVPGFYQQGARGFKLGLPRIPGPGGGQAKVWLQNPNNSITAITKGSPERVRRVLEVLNWLAAPLGTEEFTFRKYGIEGRDHTVVNGAPVLTTVGNAEVALGDFPVQYLVDAPKPIFYAGHPEGTDIVYNHVKSIQPTAILNPTYGLYSPTNSTKFDSVC